jgi:hypothetical protein
MLCFGSLKLDRAPGEMVIKDGEEVHHLPTPSPCRCDGCNTSLRKGAQVCCYQYWRPRYAPRFEEYEHGWELDFVRDPAYEWIAW